MEKDSAGTFGKLLSIGGAGYSAAVSAWAVGDLFAGDTEAAVTKALMALVAACLSWVIYRDSSDAPTGIKKKPYRWSGNRTDRGIRIDMSDWPKPTNQREARARLRERNRRYYAEYTKIPGVRLKLNERSRQFHRERAEARKNGKRD